MTDKKTEEKPDTSLKADFWTALSWELAVRGLHPDMHPTERQMVAMRYGRRRLMWLPLDMTVRIGWMRTARFLQSRGLIGGADVGDEDE